jgi:beta-phosphoglucomutase
MPSRFICVVFDLNGALFDAADLHFDSLNLALKEHLKIDISQTDHDTKFYGMSTSAKLDLLNIPSALQEEINRTKRRYMQELVDSKLRPNHDKIYLLESLRERNIYTACITNSSKDTAVNILRKLWLTDLLDTVVTSDYLDNLKPDPEGYLLAMDSLGVEPANVLAFENDDVGIKAAQAASVGRTVLIDSTCDVTFDFVKKYLS